VPRARSEHELLTAIEITQTWKHGAAVRSATGVSMPSPPSGVVSFLFTDVEGSTALWDRYPEEMNAALAEHDRRVRDAIESRGGYVFTTAGDSFSVAFAEVRDALDAVLDLQLQRRESTGEIPLRVRAGIHTGEASERDGDYFGSAVNGFSRLASAGHGGQILIS
jgi:class 3 adenylate cyclase